MLKNNKKDPDLSEVTEKYTQLTTAHIDDLMSHPAIARQYLPDMRELDQTTDEDIDPIGDNAHSPVKGIVHRYRDRVLLKPHHACAVYCRFCFRRDMVGRKGEALNEVELQQAIHYIRNHKEIWEVILTGGDPLALSPRRLQKLFDELSKIDHVKMVRIHTRVPIAAPDMVTDPMRNILSNFTKALSISVHCNHAAEITTDVSNALRKLHGAGATLVSQSVLLKNVNDTVGALEKLFRTLMINRVKPYYLHHLDKAPGTSHFRVTLKDGLALYNQLRGNLSGICIPQYMLDIPGGYGKVELNSINVSIKKDHAEITDRHGVMHIYKD